MTNTQNAQTLYDFLKFSPHVHSQESWFHVKDGDMLDGMKAASQAQISEDPNVCNTTMCIAGTAQWLMDGQEGLRKFYGGDEAEVEALDEVEDWLGISEDAGFALFYTWDNESALNMLGALANDDIDKFYAIHDEYSKNKPETWA